MMKVLAKLSSKNPIYPIYLYFSVLPKRLKTFCFSLSFPHFFDSFQSAIFNVMTVPVSPTPNAAMASLIAVTELTSPTAEFACERNLGAFQQEFVSIIYNVAMESKIVKIPQMNKIANNQNAGKRNLFAMI